MQEQPNTKTTLTMINSGNGAEKSAKMVTRFSLVNTTLQMILFACGRKRLKAHYLQMENRAEIKLALRNYLYTRVSYETNMQKRHEQAGGNFNHPALVFCDLNRSNGLGVIV